MNRIKFLAVAIVVISMTITGCGKGGNSAGSTTDSATINNAASNAAVVYINMDTLISNYSMYFDLKSLFEEKSKKIESELTSKGRSFERDMMSYQEKVQKGLVTRSQAGDMEADLQNKQQNFLKYREKSMGELAEEEQVMLNQIHYSIVEYLKVFNRDQRYGMIISTTAAGPILNADPKLDITAEVIKGLNAKYESEKKSDKTK